MFIYQGIWSISRLQEQKSMSVFSGEDLVKLQYTW